LLFCLLLALAVTTRAAHPIKHVVVLMLENRSFDHMLGFLKKNGHPEVDGLTGDERNPYKVSEPNGKSVEVNQHGYNVSPDDPGHSWTATFEQIYGRLPTHGTEKPVPHMNGFVQEAIGKKHTPYNPMSMFNQTTAPVMHSLALEFGLFDKWFCSVPGPTGPNREFAMSGTAHGWLNDFNGTLYPQETYFNFLSRHGVTWRGYYQHDPWALIHFKDMHEPANKRHVFKVDEFHKDAKAGTLPQFSWVQPKITSVNGPPTWQHPDAPVSEGERYLKTIYEALRASPQWNETAFIVTYDEHGGFYDHVAPPQENIPSPDNIHSHNGFRFDRLGIRVPTLLISPLVKKNSVFHHPTSGGPHFDSTAVIATCNKLFGINEHMTARDAWVGTFEDLFTLEEPRTDCPEILDVELPEYTDADLREQQAKPLNDHLEAQVLFYCKFNGHGAGCGSDIKNQYEASVFLKKEAKKFMSR